MGRVSSAVVGLLIAMSACTASSTSSNSSSSDGGGNREGFQGIVSSKPFADAVQMSLSPAQTVAGFAIPRPDDPLASDSQIAKVWIDTSSGQPQIEIDYSSGLSVELGTAGQHLATIDLQTSFFREQVAQEASQTNGQAQLVSIGGQPGFQVPEDSAVYANGQSQGNGGDIEFVFKGEVIDVSGRFSNADLLRIASSIVGK
jgi:hypothetical protein